MSSAALADTKNKLVISVIAHSVLQNKTLPLLNQLYTNLGKNVTFVSLPAKRALQMSNQGQTDGEVFRIWDIGNVYKNLIRVPTPVLSIGGYMFSLDKNLPQSMSELTPEHRIAIHRGIVWAEKLVKGRKGVVRVNDNITLMRKLLDGSVDIALTTQGVLRELMDERGIEQELYRAGPVSVFSVYHYLHKRHKDLVPLVDAQLDRMVRTGQLQQLTGLPYLSQK